MTYLAAGANTSAADNSQQVIEYLNHDHQYIRIFKCAYIDIQN
jgi:hypothetical protein